MKMEDVSENDLSVGTKSVVNDVKSEDEQLVGMVNAMKQKSPVMQDTTFPESNFWEVKGLPSKMKFYDPVAKIFARPLKTPEVKKISSINEDNGDFILNDIVKRTTKNINVDELYVADKLYIIFWLRANTYRDSGFIVNFICMNKECNKKITHHFEVDNLEVQFVSDSFDPNKEITLIGSGSKVKYDYLRVKDEAFIEKFKDINGTVLGDIDNEILAMAQMVKTIDSKEKNLLQKYHWVSDLEPTDFSYLRSYMEKNGMGIKPFINVKCESCGGSTPVGISFRADFFIPDYKFE
jgi:hypothetical protein